MSSFVLRRTSKNKGLIEQPFDKKFSTKKFEHQEQLKGSLKDIKICQEKFYL
jgi:hypothetical protein